MESAQGPVKDGALAGLGRGGDASCVPVILAAIRDAAPPTFQVGMDALRALPGEDVTRALIVAYPKLPSRAQLALIPVLGARRDSLVLPILEQLARSEQAETRLAALEALGDSDRLNPPQATRLQPVVKRVSPAELQPVPLSHRSGISKRVMIIVNDP